MKVLVPTASCLSPGVPAQWAKVDAVLAQWAKAVLAQWAKVVYVLDVLLLQAEEMTKIVSFAYCRLRNMMGSSSRVSMERAGEW